MLTKDRVPEFHDPFSKNLGMILTGENSLGSIGSYASAYVIARTPYTISELPSQYIQSYGKVYGLLSKRVNLEKADFRYLAEIPPYMFYRCTGLTKVYTSEGPITDIGECAFYGCEKLNYVGPHAFEPGYEGPHQQWYMPSYIGKNALYGTKPVDSKALGLCFEADYDNSGIPVNGYQLNEEDARNIVVHWSENGSVLCTGAFSFSQQHDSNDLGSIYCRKLYAPWCVIEKNAMDGANISDIGFIVQPDGLTLKPGALNNSGIKSIYFFYAMNIDPQTPVSNIYDVTIKGLSLDGPVLMNTVDAWKGMMRIFVEQEGFYGAPPYFGKISGRDDNTGDLIVADKGDMPFVEINNASNCTDKFYDLDPLHHDSALTLDRIEEYDDFIFTTIDRIGKNKNTDGTEAKDYDTQFTSIHFNNLRYLELGEKITQVKRIGVQDLNGPETDISSDGRRKNRADDPGIDTLIVGLEFIAYYNVIPLIPFNAMLDYDTFFKKDVDTYFTQERILVFKGGVNTSRVSCRKLIIRSYGYQIPVIFGDYVFSRCRFSEKGGGIYTEKGATPVFLPVPAVYADPDPPQHIHIFDIVPEKTFYKSGLSELHLRCISGPEGVFGKDGLNTRAAEFSLYLEFNREQSESWLTPDKYQKYLNSDAKVKELIRKVGLNFVSGYNSTVGLDESLGPYDPKQKVTIYARPLEYSTRFAGLPIRKLPVAEDDHSASVGIPRHTLYVWVSKRGQPSPEAYEWINEYDSCKEQILDNSDDFKGWTVCLVDKPVGDTDYDPDWSTERAETILGTTHFAPPPGQSWFSSSKNGYRNKSTYIIPQLELNDPVIDQMWSYLGDSWFSGFWSPSNGNLTDGIHTGHDKHWWLYWIKRLVDLLREMESKNEDPVIIKFFAKAFNGNSAPWGQRNYTEDGKTVHTPATTYVKDGETYEITLPCTISGIEFSTYLQKETAESKTYAMKWKDLWYPDNDPMVAEWVQDNQTT